MFKGAFTAIVTPFKDGKIDFDSFEKLIEFQIENKIDGLVPCGTTGESATLTHEEHKKVIQFVIKTVKKRVPVIAGSGSNSTAEAIELTKFAKESGADGALVITPYYNKPPQEGLYQHFRKVAETVAIPIVVYNVPGRTGINLLPSTLERLKDISNIVAVKEASGKVDQAEEILSLTEGKIDLLSGDDSLYLPMLAIGGTGIISVVSNIIPNDVAEVYKLYSEKKAEKAKELFYKYYFLTNSMFYETNPIPVKTSLKLMGKISGELRLPLCNLSKANEEKLTADLQKYELI
ncbi:MAG: 4-hydroxy-tetrahydrodipicolinate synthase [Spirochaetes bacterium]|nr:4-hydroxy-tetrahydrodipicolinate synthase [Spirochaetota bacterium]